MKKLFVFSFAAIVIISVFTASAFAVLTNTKTQTQTPGVFSAQGIEAKNEEFRPDAIVVKFKSLEGKTLPTFISSKKAIATSGRGGNSLAKTLKNSGVTLEKPAFTREERFGKTFDKLGLDRVAIMKIPAGADPAEVAAQFSRDAGVEYAEPT